MKYDVSNILRGAGFRSTTQRVAILSLLSDTGKPLSPDMLLRKLGGKADQATVYRTLEAFAAKDIIRRVHLGHAHAHYEFVTPNDHHHHMVCEGCGDIEDVQVSEPRHFEKSILEKSKKFKKISSHSLEFFGLCTACS